jgi:hypothetical protein
MFAWMPVARVRLSNQDCLCHDSFLICRCSLDAGKIAQFVTTTSLDLHGWLEMIGVARHGLLECVCVTLGGHKVSPMSNYIVMQPHHSPECTGDLFRVAACLVYTAKLVHLMYYGHLMAHDLWDGPC